MEEPVDEFRESKIYLAKLAEQAERYEEMADAMVEVVKHCNGNLTVEERNLLSVAFKNVIGARRASWRILSSIRDKEEAKGNNTDKVKLFQSKVEDELADTCNTIQKLLSNDIISKELSDDSKVFFYKMMGDYHRYMAEFAVGEARKDAAESSLVAYKEATDAASKLAFTHPIRLGLALNFSVFYYEILNNSERACFIAKSAFDDAIRDLDSLPEESYKDATIILQLLRDNLALWTSEDKKDGGASPRGEEK